MSYACMSYIYDQTSDSRLLVHLMLILYWKVCVVIRAGVCSPLEGEPSTRSAVKQQAVTHRVSQDYKNAFELVICPASLNSTYAGTASQAEGHIGRCAKVANNQTLRQGSGWKQIQNSMGGR
jgi:hypothetical protein